MNDAFIKLPYAVEMSAKQPEKHLRRREFVCGIGGHFTRENLQRFGIRWKRVSLPVLVELQPVLEVPQKLIGGSQPRILGAREETFVAQTEQSQQRSSMP